MPARLAHPTRTALCAGALIAVAALAGCSSGRPAERTVRTVVVTRTAPAPVPPAGASGTPAGTASATPSGPATPTGSTRLPGTCDDLLPLAAVDNALGRSITGQTAFVVGLPERDIGRIGYLNCRYGLPAAGSASAKIEIGVSLYRTPALAAARIPATVDDYVAHGARSAKVAVAGQDGAELTGGTGAGYTEPTLVLAAGQRTVAVTVAARPGPRTTKDLTALAALALQQTAG